jgi:hypothetical protein
MRKRRAAGNGQWPKHAAANKRRRIFFHFDLLSVLVLLKFVIL